ncbi:MAG: hypothetical protein E8D45_10890 [Nitrospira sp.]|nr:MAG: hypothetical protein E8D45_10890 [Nitrospira sp.]
MAFARTVILERVVEEFLEEEKSSYPPLERVFRALEWRIARQPEVGAPVPGTNPKRYIVKSSYRFPLPLVLTLMYRYIETEIVIELARVDEDAGE